MKELLHTQSRLALEFDLAIRSYFAKTVRPFAKNHVNEGDFLPELMSTSFVARNIFDEVLKEFPDYIIKFSSDNPRNQANQATHEELEMIKYFNNNPQVEKWSGLIKMNGQDYVTNFSAMRTEESCITCHGDPKDAPRALIERYGSIAGFHRPIGEVVGLDTIAIPVDKNKSIVFANALKEFFILFSGLFIFISSFYFVLRWLTNKIFEQEADLKVLAKFASENPNPVLRIRKDGQILYSNQAGKLLLDEWESEIGKAAPEKWCNLITKVFESDQNIYEEEQQIKSKIFSIIIVPIIEAGYVNLYASDITERKKAKEIVYEKMQELERFNKLTVGRELRMAELKHEINNLLHELGRESEYKSVKEIPVYKSASKE